MKLIPKTAAIAVVMLCSSLLADAQKIKVQEGDIAVLKEQTEVNTEFTYEHVKVGDFDNEDDYIQKKTDEYNKKEAGKGDNLATAWKADRESRFAPRFNEMFTEGSNGIKAGNFPAAKYTLIFKTTFIEPGFNVGVMRKNSYINGEIWVVETADKSKVVAKVSVDRAPGRIAFGMDFDTGARITESYAMAGRSFGRYVRK